MTPPEIIDELFNEALERPDMFSSVRDLEVTCTTLMSAWERLNDPITNGIWWDIWKKECEVVGCSASQLISDIITDYDKMVEIMKASMTKLKEIYKSGRST